MGFIEPEARGILISFLEDPQLSPGKAWIRPKTALRLLGGLFPIIVRFPLTLHNPEKTRKATQRLLLTKLNEFQIAFKQSKRLDELIPLLDKFYAQVPKIMFRRLIPLFGPGMGMLNLLHRLAAQTVKGSKLALEITRGMPHNVTTEMDLALWETARQIRLDPESAAWFQSITPDLLAQAYLNNALPGGIQKLVNQFLISYGMRGIGEIDIGRPRWKDEPTPVFQSLQSYLNIQPEKGPDVVFKNGAEHAEAAIEELVIELRSTPHGNVKGLFARQAALKLRAVAGMREMPKFFVIQVMGMIRDFLLINGQRLVQAGFLEKPEDIFFLRYSELSEISSHQREDLTWPNPVKPGFLNSRNPFEIIAKRQEIYQREKRRRQVPRFLLTDGRTFYEAISVAQIPNDKLIIGNPVSPGVVEGLARVVLDPHQTNLKPGEIMICKGTDPAWTPLFLVAGGLIMEVGGLMTHGSVVAREYGIPAAVGVNQATQIFRTGERIRLDGASGKIVRLSA